MISIYFLARRVSPQLSSGRGGGIGGCTAEVALAAPRPVSQCPGQAPLSDAREMVVDTYLVRSDEVKNYALNNINTRHE